MRLLGKRRSLFTFPNSIPRSEGSPLFGAIYSTCQAQGKWMWTRRLNTNRGYQDCANCLVSLLTRLPPGGTGQRTRGRATGPRAVPVRVSAIMTGASGATATMMTVNAAGAAGAATDIPSPRIGTRTASAKRGTRTRSGTRTSPTRTRSETATVTGASAAASGTGTTTAATVTVTARTAVANGRMRLVRTNVLSASVQMRTCLLRPVVAVMSAGATATSHLAAEAGVHLLLSSHRSSKLLLLAQPISMADRSTPDVSRRAMSHNRRPRRRTITQTPSQRKTTRKRGRFLSLSLPRVLPPATSVTSSRTSWAKGA
jgi:hypothetical protein